MAISAWSTPSKVFAQAIGTFTVFNGNIEMSLDGGTTWAKFTTFDFAANPSFDFEASNGPLFRFNTLNITQSVPPDIWVSL